MAIPALPAVAVKPSPRPETKSPATGKSFSHAVKKSAESKKQTSPSASSDKKVSSPKAAHPKPVKKKGRTVRVKKHGHRGTPQGRTQHVMSTLALARSQIELPPSGGKTPHLMADTRKSAQHKGGDKRVSGKPAIDGHHPKAKRAPEASLRKVVQVLVRAKTVPVGRLNPGHPEAKPVAKASTPITHQGQQPTKLQPTAPKSGSQDLKLPSSPAGGVRKPHRAVRKVGRRPLASKPVKTMPTPPSVTVAPAAKSDKPARVSIAPGVPQATKHTGSGGGQKGWTIQAAPALKTPSSTTTRWMIKPPISVASPMQMTLVQEGTRLHASLQVHHQDAAWMGSTLTALPGQAIRMPDGVSSMAFSLLTSGGQSGMPGGFAGQAGGQGPPIPSGSFEGNYGLRDPAMSAMTGPSDQGVDYRA